MIISSQPAQINRLYLRGSIQNQSLFERCRTMLQFYHVSRFFMLWKLICNAPGCTVAATKTCGKCHTARYCSRSCQVEDWKSGHKRSCESLIGWDASYMTHATLSVLLAAGRTDARDWPIAAFLNSCGVAKQPEGVMHCLTDNEAWLSGAQQHALGITATTSHSRDRRRAESQPKTE